MISLVQRYYHWLHGKWPAGTPEKLPLINKDGTTALNGTYVVGDLTGVPLLKISADSGAKAVQHIASDESFKRRTTQAEVFDLVIIGGGVSGYAAALEAQANNLNFLLLEASEPFSTIGNFPKGKPIFTYPKQMTPEGKITFHEFDSIDSSINSKHDRPLANKESLLKMLQEKVANAGIQHRIARASHVKRKSGLMQVFLGKEEPHINAHRVIIAIGRSGNYRKLGIEGENSVKCLNRLHDPKIFSGKNLVIVGGGDSALEASIATCEAGANVTLCHRNSHFPLPKPANLEKLMALKAAGKLEVKTETVVTKIEAGTVKLKVKNQAEEPLANDAVLSLIGREAPLNFFRRSGIPISGESHPIGWLYFALFFVGIMALYDWKNYGWLNQLWSSVPFPNKMPDILSSLGPWWQQLVAERDSLVGTIAVSMKSRSFYYTLLYSACIGYFGWKRIKRRQTPYVTVQTASLFFIQVIPLFLLPEILLPWLGYQGFFDNGTAKEFANSLFPSYISVQELAAHHWPEWGHPRAYWHAYGFILAWPLNVYNVFTPTPMAGWLIISAVQTFVIIPALIYKFGKGAYCGWICSCGALAETMGDTHRHKMPRGSFWNKLNMLGQVILLFAFILLAIRIGGWLAPESWMNQSFGLLLKGENSEYQLVNLLSWKWFVDVILGGVLGVGLYFKFSGRVWCRFACPLSALMHIYSRFSRFRIFADKDKCISCNSCTSVCHQGIDVMSFANKGQAMQDPECVRCSACVSTCPTGVLSFGQINKKTKLIACVDVLAASPVQIQEAQTKSHH